MTTNWRHVHILAWQCVVVPLLLLLCWRCWQAYLPHGLFVASHVACNSICSEAAKPDHCCNAIFNACCWCCCTITTPPGERVQVFQRSPFAGSRFSPFWLQWFYHSSYLMLTAAILIDFIFHFQSVCSHIHTHTRLHVLQVAAKRLRMVVELLLPAATFSLFLIKIFLRFSTANPLWRSAICLHHLKVVFPSYTYLCAPLFTLALSVHLLFDGFDRNCFHAAFSVCVAFYTEYVRWISHFFYFVSLLLNLLAFRLLSCHTFVHLPLFSYVLYFYSFWEPLC